MCHGAPGSNSSAMVIVRTKRQKEAELAARERRIEYEKTEKIMGQEVVAEKGTVWTVQ